MQRRKLTLSLALAGLVSFAAVSAVAGQDPDEDSGEQLPATETRTGTLEAVTDADGDIEYQLNDDTGATVPLSVGPPWFWGEDHPLADITGKVTVTGEVDDGTPPAHAHAADRPDGVRSFDVFTVNGETIREAGKPLWAGGPAVVLERHPGYDGWSRGQAARDAGADDADSAP
jgi:hypothetical protein